eukprot:5123670-Pyramimonas_sp.AAC.1
MQGPRSEDCVILLSPEEGSDKGSRTRAPATSSEETAREDKWRSREERGERQAGSARDASTP